MGDGARGSCHLASGASLISNMARWESDREAHESGGGDGGRLSSMAPAITSTPTPGAGEMLGMSSPHNIPKYAGTSFDCGGKFSQIWNSSNGFGPSGLI